MAQRNQSYVTEGRYTGQRRSTSMAETRRPVNKRGGPGPFYTTADVLERSETHIVEEQAQSNSVDGAPPPDQTIATQTNASGEPHPPASGEASSFTSGQTPAP